MSQSGNINNPGVGSINNDIIRKRNTAYNVIIKIEFDDKFFKFGEIICNQSIN